MESIPQGAEPPGVAALKRQLQKVMKKIVSSLPKIRESESKHQKEVASLSNLLEQLECVRSADCPLLTVMGQELQAKMMVKLSKEIEITAQGLKDSLCLLKDLYDTTSKAHRDAISLCQQYRHDLDPATMSQGLPTVPPLLVMLGWLDTVNHQLKEQHLSRLHYLLCLNEPEVSQNITALWQEDMNALWGVGQDIQEQTKYFLQEKL